MTDLNGKIAIVTGASGGIGQAVAVAMATAGADVAICGQNKDRLAATAELISATGRKVLSYSMNIGQAESIQQTVEDVHKNWGRVDVLVNNAGITRDQLLLRMKDEDWQAILDTNLSSVFRLSRAVLRGMLKARRGRIISIASVIGLTGNAGQSNYAAAKAGIIGFTKSLAREVGSRGITANVVAPGFIETDMTRALPEATRSAMLGDIALGRLGSPADIAHAVAFLAGPGAAYVTGETLHVNGGMYMP